MGEFRSVATVILSALLFAMATADAAQGDCGGAADDADNCVMTTESLNEDQCGDANRDLQITATDANMALRWAVGLPTGHPFYWRCMPRYCDIDGSGSITALDALGILRLSVELPSDPSCPIGSTTSST